MAKRTKLSESQIETLLKDHADWAVNETGDKLLTGFEFENFSQAVNFINAVAALAEEIEHHPDIYLFDYKFLQILTSTHEVTGFSDKDLELIERIDSLSHEHD